MRKTSYINKQIFIGYSFLAISILSSLIYIFSIDFNLSNNYDSFNYFWGYNYLANNFFDIGEVKTFGRFPEFIYPLVLSALSILGKLKDIKIYTFISSLITFAFLLFSYLNIDKLYNKNFSADALGLQLQMLAVLIPLGLTVQVSRQSFALYLFLSVLIITRKIKYFSSFFSSLILICSHYSSISLIGINYFYRNKKLLFLAFYFIFIFASFNFLISYFRTYESTLINDFNFFSRFIFLDKYFLTSILSLLIIRGFKFFLDKRFLIFIIISLMYLYFSSVYTILQRFLYGIGWFWVLLIGLEIIGENKIIRSRSKINLITLLILIAKLYILIQSFKGNYTY